MMTFVENLNAISDDFVFKGGNLLWLYIKTPRATVDIDFVTKTLKSHDAVKQHLEKACVKSAPDIVFNITSFRGVSQQGELGAAITVRFETRDGAVNTFDLDIVYAIPTRITELPAPIQQDPKIQVATLENIIADKLSAAHRFKGGNTRMKDFDDLWRISKSDKKIDKADLKILLKSLKTSPELDPEWIDPAMEESWRNHIQDYKDLPTELHEVVSEINTWVARTLK
jgi:hypothetical protein